MTPSILVFALALPFLAAVPAETQAASGDTRMFVNYRTKSVRVKPTPLTGGANVSFRIVLHADGTVDDYHEVVGDKKGTAKSRLGKGPKNVVYRVEDGTTITRATDVGNHLHRITVELVSRTSCTAQVDFILKSGNTEFRSYSTQLKQMASYSIQMDSSDCRITD